LLDAHDLCDLSELIGFLRGGWLSSGAAGAFRLRMDRLGRVSIEASGVSCAESMGVVCTMAV
jgi:hypothetical protein